MKQHFLQSPTWQKYQQLENHKTFHIDGEDFSATVVLESTPLGNYLSCPYGPTLLDTSSTENTINSLQNALHSLSELARKQSAFFARIEPTLDLEDPNPLSPHVLKQLGLKKSHDINPAHTWQIDLTQPEANLLKQMRKSNVQYWHSHQKKGLKIHTSQNPEDISLLTSLLQNIGDRNHFNPQSESHLKNQIKSGFATLYIAEYNNEPLAVSLIYDDPETRFYAHAATSEKERKLAAGTVLLVQMILDAKNRGAKTFDFWGITTSDNKSHPWYGFTQYKKSFGGYQVNYAGTWDYPLNHPKYTLYTILRKLNRLKRKVY